MEYKIYIKTFGCQMNVYDSKKILEILNIYFKIIKIKNKEDANIIILNTCSIREKAKEKFFSELGRISKLKKKKKFLICIGGCVAQEEKEKIFKRSPLVDIIFSPKTLHMLPTMIKNHEKNKKQIKINSTILKKFLIIKKKKKNNNPTAFLTIMEGCNKFCSYCIVPQTRGKEISRNIKNILEEIKEFIKQGKKEIILLGQNVNAFKNFKNNKKKDFSDLIKYISKIPEIKRIKFITNHPKEFTEKLINSYINNSKLGNHIYLPVQHASNKILKKMRRGYTIEEYKNIIYKIKKIKPNISISTDFIIGFPGENDNDFKKLINLINEIKFDTSYSFIYSPRLKTLAAKFINNIPEIIKKYRLQYIQTIIKKNIYKINKNMIGSKQYVLVENISKKNPLKLTGKTENNKIVNFYIKKNKKKIIGKIIPIKITKAFQFYLEGKII
ncbi:tRNA (N6-isopentenyl adenosine(37)-C2)-methylthiotransferase MiaB [Candidatus Zinderia endosymbiont of Aphrophora alni]|uniref:tRNA (N6-isopentenyl adenosine(37)-C2)-methylthiotransferase MiaB n=1 Tax=Candidatus Zinderia endosymbiont of Aphrophora alni TaxID=3077951 RepID=UPI0030D0F743